MNESQRSLDQLRPRQQGVVRSLHGDGPLFQRLHEMGVTTGTLIEVLRYAPLGDPMEVSLRGFNLTLRKSEAALVEIEQ